MEYKIIRSESFNEKTWSGGKTTELFIFPQTAKYQDLDFSFRLSTAKVETEKSEFTKLNGISRKLMVLKGATTLYHENHHSIHLDRFEIDTFMGEWKTTSKGMCTDFNLMTASDINGELSSLVLKRSVTSNFIVRVNLSWIFIYVYAGSIEIGLENRIITLNNGDLFLIKEPSIKEFEMAGIRKSEIVFVEISKQ